MNKINAANLLWNVIYGYVSCCVRKHNGSDIGVKTAKDFKDFFILSEVPPCWDQRIFHYRAIFIISEFLIANVKYTELLKTGLGTWKFFLICRFL